VYQQHVSSLDELKEKIQQSSHELSQDFVNRAIEQWHQILRSVVKCNGGHIEQLFNWCSHLFMVPAANMLK